MSGEKKVTESLGYTLTAASSTKKENFERTLLSKTCFKCRGHGHLDYMCTSTDKSVKDRDLSPCKLCQGTTSAPCA